MTRRFGQDYRKGTAGNIRGGSTAGYRDAVDLEDAADAINRINARVRRENYEANVARRKQVTLGGGDALAAWLRKDVP